MAEVGKHIRKIRKERNLTQDELAARLHCTRQTISNYETGRSEPRIELLVEIADVLGVEIGVLIYGPKKKENRKRQKVTSVIIVMASVVLLLLIRILTPLAREYMQRKFALFPMGILQHMLRPLAMTLFGWGIVQAVKELAGISIWSGKAEKAVRAARIVYYMTAVCLAVMTAVTLWQGLDEAYMWYLSEQLKGMPGGFSWDMVPHLVPAAFRNWFFYFFYHVNGFVGGYLFLGASLAFFRIDKADRTEGENQTGE